METGQEATNSLQRYKSEDTDFSKIKFEYNTDEKDPGLAASFLF
jgi:hypothetical protein